MLRRKILPSIHLQNEGNNILLNSLHIRFLQSESRVLETNNIVLKISKEEIVGINQTQPSIPKITPHVRVIELTNGDSCLIKLLEPLKIGALNSILITVISESETDICHSIHSLRLGYGQFLSLIQSPEKVYLQPTLRLSVDYTQFEVSFGLEMDSNN